MGAREDLLAGAKRCLLENGYTRTTARDIAAASGANLASIGYHYGSKQALMRQALIESSSDWGDEMERVVAEEARGEADTQGRRERVWEIVIDLFREHQALWRAQLEAVLEAENDPELREALRALQPLTHRGLVAVFEGVPTEEVSEEDERVLGPFYVTLVSGLMTQRIAGYAEISGSSVVAAVRRLSESDNRAAGRSATTGQN